MFKKTELTMLIDLDCCCPVSPYLESPMPRYLLFWVPAVSLARQKPLQAIAAAGLEPHLLLTLHWHHPKESSVSKSLPLLQLDGIDCSCHDKDV